MVSLLKNAAKRYLPKAVVQAVQRALYSIHIYNHRKYWRLPERTSDECIVVGNGPSLSQSVEKICNYPADIYTVNDVCCTDFFLKLSPVAHFFLDPQYFNDEAHVKRACDFSFSTHVQKTHYYFEQRQQRCSLMVPTIVVPLVRKQYYQIKNIFGFCVTPVTKNVSRSIKQIEKGHCGISGVNSVIPAIQTACLAGYKKVWLAGVDMSCFNFCVDKHCRIQRAVKHFYTDKFETGERDFSNVANFYRDIANVFDAFDLLRELALYKNVQVINTSLDSMVQSFPKGDLGEEPNEWLAGGYINCPAVRKP